MYVYLWYLQRSKTVIADAEKEKLQKEYEEFDKQLNEAKDEYTKENPDAAHKEPDEQEYVSVNISMIVLYAPCTRINSM